MTDFVLLTYVLDEHGVDEGPCSKPCRAMVAILAPVG